MDTQNDGTRKAVLPFQVWLSWICMLNFTREFVWFDEHKLLKTMLQFVDQTVITVGELLTKNMQSNLLGSLLYQLVDCHMLPIYTSSQSRHEKPSKLPCYIQKERMVVFQPSFSRPMYKFPWWFSRRGPTFIPKRWVGHEQPTTPWKFGSRFHSPSQKKVHGKGWITMDPHFSSRFPFSLRSSTPLAEEIPRHILCRAKIRPRNKRLL